MRAAAPPAAAAVAELAVEAARAQGDPAPAVVQMAVQMVAPVAVQMVAPVAVQMVAPAVVQTAGPEAVRVVATTTGTSRTDHR